MQGDRRVSGWTGHLVIRTKLADVARAAGVSPATVSRVLNNPEIVRPEVQARVREAIGHLRFTPNSAARALKSRRSWAIGSVVPTLGVAIFADGIGALQSRLREHGYTLLIANSEYDPKRELEEVSVLLDRGVDGIVLVGEVFDPNIRKLAKQRSSPIVTTYIYKSKHRVPAIGIDNATATYSMARYLLDLGHWNFGMITDAARKNDRTEARRHGAERALAEAGISGFESHVVGVSYSIANGRVGLRKLLSRDPGITAVICTSDALAIGALVESRALGLGVPRDLSITGFDDIDISAHTEPPLTTIHVPASEIGRLAADHIVSCISGSPVPRTSQLAAEIVFRGSCAPPRKGKLSTLSFASA
jgi:LacI family transcriptional regulator